MTARELVRLRDISSVISRQQSHGEPTFVVDAALHTSVCTALHESPQPSLELPSFLALALTPGSLVPRLAYR
jgi:hypothetical protein